MAKYNYNSRFPESNILTTLKIIVIGESNAGKSSLLLRFTDDEFNPYTKVTVGVDNKTKTVKLDDGRAVKLCIWDTAGSERYRSLAHSFYREAQGAILVFDVSDRASFLGLESWFNELEMHSTRSDIVKMIVGNKIDNVDRVISREEGVRLARRRGTLYQEASNKTKKYVEFVFQDLVEKIIETPSLWKRERNLNLKVGEIRKKPAETGCCS